MGQNKIKNERTALKPSMPVRQAESGSSLLLLMCGFILTLTICPGICLTMYGAFCLMRNASFQTWTCGPNPSAISPWSLTSMVFAGRTVK